MKQKQRGVSMVSLVITIIVIIILAAVAFSGSQETIGRAGFSGYTTDIDSVRTAFITEGVTSLMGEEETRNNTVTKAQAYNYLAKGATTNRITKEQREHAWLSKSQASAIPCTRIEKEYAKDAIGIKLPERKVNTYGASGVEIEYFVTNKGDIFTWPPFFRSDDGLFYVNDATPVYAVDPPLGLISGDDEAKMYEDGFTFIINGVEIKVQGTGAALTPITVDLEPSVIKTMATIGYKDERNPKQAVGLETEVVYQDDGTSAGGSNGAGGSEEPGEEENCTHTWDAGVQTTAPTATTTGVKTYTCTLCGETKTEEIPMIVGNSIVSVAKVGDYVNYSANGITSWRVFDIKNGEVLITPASGPTSTKLTLTGVDGYVNAVTKIEEACDAYTNSSLGITVSNVRSMTVEDINRVAGYTPVPSTIKYAYFLYNDSTYGTTTVMNGYTKKKHTPVLNGWETPRFYTYDSATNISSDGYAYPTKGKPVYVTETGYFYDLSNMEHVGNSDVKVGSLLGDSYGWLASSCVYLEPDIATFFVRVANSSDVGWNHITGSDSISDSFSYGVRPLVSLGSGLQATRADESSPWELSR